MRREKINAALSRREYALIDFERKGVDWALRISPHFYNTEAEIHAAADALQQCVRELSG